jgi:hypothetical protein
MKEEAVVFDFGIVSAGESIKYEYTILNDSSADIVELGFIIDNSEVKIISAPTEIKSQEVAKLVLEWKPSVTLKQGLKEELKITGYEIYK